MFSTLRVQRVIPGVMVEQSLGYKSIIYITSSVSLKKKNDTYLLKPHIFFDVSVTELFGWLLEGGRLAILEPGGERTRER